MHLNLRILPFFIQLFWYIHMLSIWLIWSICRWNMSTLLTVLVLWSKCPPVWISSLASFIIVACFTCSWTIFMRTDASHSFDIFHIVSWVWVLKSLIVIVFINLKLVGHLWVLFQLSLFNTFFPAHKANQKDHQDKYQTNNCNQDQIDLSRFFFSVPLHVNLSRFPKT